MPPSEFHQLCDAIQDVLRKEHGIPDHVRTQDVLSSQIYIFYRITNNVRFARGRVLDIGCGAVDSRDKLLSKLDEQYKEKKELRPFDPWLLRILEIAGRLNPAIQKDLLGIDMYPQAATEKFPSIVSDISIHPNALHGLPAESFSFVNNNLCIANFDRPSATSPTMHALVGESAGRLQKIYFDVLAQATRVLEMGGYYLENGDAYRKEEQGLKHIGRLRNINLNS